MPGSEVFFADMRARPRRSLLDKLDSLSESAGLSRMDLEKRFVAVKIHLGEPGNLAFIRPNYAARVVSRIRASGGRPFLTDTNSLYVGRRSDAVSHLDTAAENGFTKTTVGCDVIIADGLKGTEYREIEIDLERCHTAKIASAIADADALVNLSHFKGHEMTGFGGAIKNIGMGGGSRAGKLEMHSTSKPRINTSNCVACAYCVKSCPSGAVHIGADKKAVIDYDICIGCGQCIAMCQYEAAKPVLDESTIGMGEKVAEYAYAAVKDKPALHFNFVMDVSPYCDCWGHNDAAIVADVGMAAGADPVALDRACADMVNTATLSQGSMIADSGLTPGEDKFDHIFPETSWRACLDHAEKIGLGTQEYFITKID